MVFYTLTVESPECIAGDYEAHPVCFGKQIYEGVTTLPLCDCGADASRLRRRDVNGSIAMHVRSDRKSDLKICQQLQSLYASAILLVHRRADPVELTLPQQAPGTQAKIEIPVFAINRADGQAISSQALNQGFADPVIMSFVGGVKDMYSFGAGISGQLGGSGPDGFIPHASPLSMVRDKCVKEVGCGLTHTIVLLDSGMVFGFGNNEHGQLALGDRAPRTTPAFCDYFHDEGIFVDKIAVGGNHNLASSNVTGLWTWGWNDFSQLGHKGADNHDSADIPQSLFELEGKKILSIAAGYMHSVCLVLNWRLRDSMVIDDYELKKKARRAEDNKEIVKIDSEFLGNGNKKQRTAARSHGEILFQTSRS